MKVSVSLKSQNSDVSDPNNLKSQILNTKPETQNPKLET